MWFFRRQLVSRGFLVGCFALTERKNRKTVFPTLFFFFPESLAIVFPTLPKGLRRNLFHAPDFVFPPLCIPASLAESICKWYHLSAYCHLPPAHPFIKCLQLGAGLPCPPCSIVPPDPGEGVRARRGGKMGLSHSTRSRGPGKAGGAAGKAQLHGESDSSPSPSGSDGWPCRDSSPGPPSPQTGADIMG